MSVAQRRPGYIILRMTDREFEGSLVLERLAKFGRVDEFYEAVDSDDFMKVKELLKVIELDPKTISTVLQKMKE